MNFARTELLSILPIPLRQSLQSDGLIDLEAIRLRRNSPGELVEKGRSRWMKEPVKEEDLQLCINAASHYSPWSAASMASGYLTAPGGHRIGICGEMVCKNGCITGVRKIHSLCIRVAKDYPGIAATLSALSGSILILGPPGSGKTTLMRDLIRQRSDRGIHVAVADERGELFPRGISTGRCTDIMTGCIKAEAVEMLLRTMGPECIALDEITAQADCQALIQAANCGVSLLATAHGASMDDLQNRPVYEQLIQKRIFRHIVLMHRDKTWHLERSM